MSWTESESSWLTQLLFYYAYSYLQYAKLKGMQAGCVRIHEKTVWTAQLRRGSLSMIKKKRRKRKLQKSNSDAVCVITYSKHRIVTYIIPNIYLKHIYTYTKPLFGPHNRNWKQAEIQDQTSRNKIAQKKQLSRLSFTVPMKTQMCNQK